MNKTLVIALLFIVAVGGASAAGLRDAQYIVVVPGGQHAADVVTGANFAASMKSTQGITYTSAIDTDAYAQLTDSDLQGKTIVVINGNAVKILGSDPAAQSYFAQQGLSVQIVNNPTRNDLLAEDNTATPQQIGQDQTNAKPGEQEDRNTGSAADTVTATSGSVPERPQERDTTFVVDQKPAQETDTSAPEVKQDSQDSAQAPAQDSPRDSPGLMTRFWRWFAGLF